MKKLNSGFFIYFTSYLMLILFPVLVFMLGCIIAGLVEFLSRIWIGIFIYVILGIVMAIFFTKKNYIKNTQETILESNYYNNMEIMESTEINSVANEGIMQEILEDKEELKFNIKKDWLKSDFIYRLVAEGRVGSEEIKQAKALYDIEFAEKEFGIIMFYIEMDEELQESEREKTIKYRFEIFRDIANEKSVAGTKVHTFMVNGMFGYLVITNKRQSEEFVNPFKRLTKEVERAAWVRGGLKTIGAASDTATRPDKATEEYRKSVEILSHKVVIKTNNIPRNIRGEIKGMDRWKFQDKEDKASSPEFQEAQKRKLYIQKFQDTKTGMITQNARMRNKGSGEQMNRIGEIANEIKSHIDKNYYVQDLSGVSMAKKFGITPVQLTRVFRAEFGQGALEYIHMIRVNKSKELLENRDMTIKEIAERVGYAYSKTYIQIFKKMEGVTPGQYREDEEMNT